MNKVKKQILINSSAGASGTRRGGGVRWVLYHKKESHYKLVLKKLEDARQRLCDRQTVTSGNRRILTNEKNVVIFLFARKHELVENNVTQFAVVVYVCIS